MDFTREPRRRAQSLVPEALEGWVANQLVIIVFFGCHQPSKIHKKTNPLLNGTCSRSRSQDTGQTALQEADFQRAWSALPSSEALVLEMPIGLPGNGIT